MAINRLRELRESNDLMQREVAKALGITQKNYSYFETGQTLLTEDILIKLLISMKLALIIFFIKLMLEKDMISLLSKIK